MIRDIPDSEFKERQKKVQEKVRENGLDIAIVHSHEADFANVRYLSDYWPIFETAGVLIPSQGDLMLLIGPESETFAEGRSKIKSIKKILQYRESAEPSYPDIDIDSFESVFKEASNGKKIKRIGIIGYPIMPITVYEAIRNAAPDAEIIKADDIMTDMRIIKSENEIALLKEGFRISELALIEIINNIKPGMTELEIVGIAQAAMYANGAEYEAHPTYVLSGKRTNNAIGRPTHRRIEKGDMIQLCIGARVGGYSPSAGRPVCIGKMSPEMRKLVEVGLEAHYKTIEFIKEGVIAKDVVNKFFDFVKSKGCGDNLLYGPCHGLGMIEVERPWMESDSTYLLRENMTFQVDTFLQSENFGLRWENGIRVTKNGAELMSDKEMRIIEI